MLLSIIVLLVVVMFGSLSLGMEHTLNAVALGALMFVIWWTDVNRPSLRKKFLRSVGLLVVAVLAVGCGGELDHGFRASLAVKGGYPTYCQRDINHDGWYTLEEGHQGIYGDLPKYCPDCTQAGAVPVYNASSDTSFWDTDVYPVHKVQQQQQYKKGGFSTFIILLFGMSVALYVLVHVLDNPWVVQRPVDFAKRVKYTLGRVNGMRAWIGTYTINAFRECPMCGKELHMNNRAQLRSFLEIAKGRPNVYSFVDACKWLKKVKERKLHHCVCTSCAEATVQAFVNPESKIDANTALSNYERAVEKAIYSSLSKEIKVAWKDFNATMVPLGFDSKGQIKMEPKCSCGECNTCLW